jgi:hypothetical protein
MAKGPGPILALAGLGALFMLGRGKDSAAATITNPDDFESLLEELDGEEVEVDDDSPPPASGGTSGSRGGGTGDNPPNLTGDLKGYNSVLWSGPRKVREALRDMSYNVAVNDDGLGRGNPEVKKFQKDYNLAATASGAEPLGAVGVILEDGTAGTHTLNGLELVIFRGGTPADWKAFRELYGTG